MSDTYFAGDKEFRAGGGSQGESLEVTPAWGPGVIVSLDSFDAPELSARLTPEAARALAQFLLDHAEGGRK